MVRAVPAFRPPKHYMMQLDEFEADLDLLSDVAADLRVVLDQRRGQRPPPAEHGS